MEEAAPSRSEYSASFVRQSVPAKMEVGKVCDVSITMRNTGTKPWTPNAASPFRLGSQAPQDNTTWGLSRCELPRAAPVMPGQEVTFSFQVRAPRSSGPYPFQWQMLQELVQWFGSPSGLMEISVQWIID